jgi:hypothetical protein
MHRSRQLLALGMTVSTVLLVGLTFAPAPATATDLAAAFAPNACGDGRIDGLLEQFDATTFTIFKADPSIPDPALSTVEGCNGNALSFGYDLTNESQDGQSWIVLQKMIPPTDLSGYTHLRMALRGLNLNSHHDVEIKLGDGDSLHSVRLKSVTDLPVWRVIYIDFREFSDYPLLDLTAIMSFEIAVVRCAEPVCEVADIPGSPQPANDPTGTILIDELAYVDFKPGAPYRVVQAALETVEHNRPVARAAAQAIYDEISPAGPGADLVPAWFPEQVPNYNTYAQAEALLVFTYEYQWSNNVIYRDAARALARKLLSLQIPEGRSQAGAWYTAYDSDLQPPFRSPPPGGGQPQRCNGDEAITNDIDACQWVGNVGWVLIALGNLQRTELYDDPAALQSAIERGADWVLGQVGRDPVYPTLISRGSEGNISAYFGLLAAGRRPEATQLGEALFAAAWDDTQRRLRPGAAPEDAATAMDVSGSWGPTLLRSIGRTQEALDSQGYTVSILRTSSFDGSVIGYGDIAGPFTVVVEFSAQGVVAGIKDAQFVMEQLYPLQVMAGEEAGAFPGATDHWYGGALLPWSTTMRGVSPTAWIYFAASGIDPLWDAHEGRIHPWFRVYLPMVAK